MYTVHISEIPEGLEGRIRTNWTSLPVLEYMDGPLRSYPGPCVVHELLTNDLFVYLLTYLLILPILRLRRPTCTSIRVRPSVPVGFRSIGSFHFQSDSRLSRRTTSRRVEVPKTVEDGLVCDYGSFLQIGQLNSSVGLRTTLRLDCPGSFKTEGKGFNDRIVQQRVPD